jgi:LuxR family quorum-sensing system transcriptional regulator CciR
MARISDTGLLRLAREFESRAATVSSLAALRDLVEGAAGDLGFAFVGLVHHVSFRRSDPKLVHLENYPQGWRDYFVDGKLFLDDPVLQASQRRAKAFAWTDVGKYLPLEARHEHVLERSARFGMGAGFTIPANLHGEPSASCSLAVKRGRQLPEKRLRAAELIGIDALDAARRLNGQAPSRIVPHLSRRQRQCLRLASAGKSDWEIASILGIGYETARRYMKSARAQYDVVSRTQLVVHALRDGQISFDDSIAPFG